MNAAEPLRAKQPLLKTHTRRMLAAELAAGREPVTPLDCPAWLNPEDWRGWPVLSIDRDEGELHIVAVWASRRGALTDLLAGAKAAGLSPVVVCPFGPMRDILKHWGWTRTTVGTGWHQRPEWRPPANG